MTPTLHNFIAHLELAEGKSEKTTRKYFKELSRFFSLCGIQKPEQITQEKIQEFRAKINGSVKVATRNHYLIALRKFLKWCKKQKIETLDAQDVELADTDERTISVLTEQEIRAIFTEAKKDIRANAIIQTLYSTGLRIHELAALPKALHLTQEGGYTVRGKGGRVRLVHFSKEAQTALQTYTATRTDTDPRLFPIAMSNIASIVRRTARHAGVNASPHDIRHLFATNLRRQGVDLLVLQKMLGHKRPETTAIYAHVVDHDMQKAHALLPAY